ncbi:L-histidine N(alpha)-methyltransferase [Conexibacter sp. SYSU D00693]|uniref:L-histidine N(alpha)-methyltransferase n=1 Tax=Conexibacter sp. SYSU D00693 TaxID=2812560 RepID=UPI00196A6EBD|nr:L-histidine N(alpha)-methyltransferase [Conexibacter sp. SYSU D00693]
MLGAAKTATCELEDVRERTLGLVAHLSDAELERQVTPFMSPLVWDLAHIAAFEELWLAHRHGGLPLLHPELAATYDAFETPRAVRGEVEHLDPAGARAYLGEVRARVREVLERRGPDPVLHELVLRHELQHTETMLQAMRLGGLLPPGFGHLAALAGPSDWVEVPAATATIGAGTDGFSYDNERPRHPVELGAFEIARRPVTNGAWLEFTADGGYARRELWSAEGWAWRAAEGVEGHVDAHLEDPLAPVCCVSAHEADAFARWAGARLPTEAEWEHAAATGAVEDTGLVWEWTSSTFGGYPGFVAEPYREYSEVFFDDGYRVLRGGSWATDPRVAGTTFRNWDLPVRRQLFAGLRLARDPQTPTCSRDGAVTIRQLLGRDDERALADDALDGLTQPFKELAPKHLYDARGAELFDAICDLPEYYPTRAERRLLEVHSATIARRTAATELVELGSGTAAKSRLLLRAMHEAGRLRRYVPIDVTESMVRRTGEELVDELPGLEVHGIVGDFERHLGHVPATLGDRLVAFLGGTIGNFTPGTRRRFLRRLAQLAGPQGRLLVGCDLVKDVATVEAAYDDAAGVTAQFNRNALHVLNRELGADFDVDAFEHVAFFDREHEWIEMRLRATRPMRVHVAALDLDVHFAAGEELRTEISAKFTPQRLEADLAAAGLELEELFVDEEGFALALARRAAK